MNALRNFVKDESGASAVEYGLILSLIVLVVITGIGALGNAVLTRLYGQALTIFPS